MKTLRWSIFWALALSIAASTSYSLDAKWKGTILSIAEVEKRWGHDPLNAKTFQSGNSTIRSKMTSAILKEKTFLKQPTSEVEKQLGRPDGYFGSEKVPAYLIEDGRSTHKPSWQLVFYPDEEGKVSDVFVQENSSELSYKRKLLQ